MKIGQILDKIDYKQLFVPAFQREYVWKRADAKNLVSSLIQDYPTGTMLTWETSNPPELKGDHAYSEAQGAVKLILDGQQRITTLYMLIRGEIPPYYTDEEIAHDVRGLHYNVISGELEYFKKTRMENDPSWVDITKVFTGEINPVGIIQEIAGSRELSNEDQLKIMSNLQAVNGIKEREFLEQTVPVKATIREAIDIFYRVNSSGVNLTDAELALAQISGYWPDAREQIKQKKFELEASGWVFKLDFFIYCLLGVVHHMGSKMEKLHDASNKEAVQTAWARLSGETLDYVCNVMQEHAFVDHTKEINSYYALVPVMVYAYSKGKQHLSETEIRKIIKWFYYSQIRTRYISQLPQKLDKDIGIVARESNPFDKLLGLIEDDRRLEIRPDEFIGVGIQHPLWGLMKWYLKSKGAKCLTTGVGIRKNMGAKYSLEWDHIFPFSVLKQNGYGFEDRHKYSLAQEIMNRAILSQKANRTKSNMPAAAYLAEARGKFGGALELQVIPEDERLWELENFERFLAERRRMMAGELNTFLEALTTTEHQAVGLTPEDLIAQGENYEVEFKTTLRWDVRQQTVNKKLEGVILKTISAFSNGEGGTLIIGVNDDMGVEGLDADYASLKGGDKDGFELHLRNLVNEAFGVEFATSNLRVTFPTVDEREICMVEIKPGLKPLYLSVPDKSGQKSDKFYVRSGNSSQELGVTEISEYLSKRFDS